MSPLYKMLYEKLERNKTDKESRRENMLDKKRKTRAKKYAKKNLKQYKTW